MVSAKEMGLSPRKIKVSVVQMGVDESPKEARLERMKVLLKDTRGSDLVVLPELWGVGYFSFDRYRPDSEPITGTTVEAMRQIARELRITLMMGSFVEKQGSRLYNTSALISAEGDLLGVYRKVHLFGFQSEEQKLLTRGRQVSAVRSPFTMIGLSTCFDLRFPELYRKQFDAGAEMFLVASAWPHPRLDHWKTFTRARAIENQSFLIAANCAGLNRGKKICGHSVIVGPFGEVIAEANEDEAILRAEIDLNNVAEIRRSFPLVSCRVLK